jgi:hypothetical protein
MTSEAVHSVVDTTNEILFLYGIHRSNQKAEAGNPFGYGREIQFWSFVVSLLIFALGAGFSIYIGVSRILPTVPTESRLSLAVLSLDLSENQDSRQSLNQPGTPISSRVSCAGRSPSREASSNEAFIARS